MEGRLSGKLAIVTGASSGIGAAIARAFAREGARVILAARRTEQLRAVAEHIPTDQAILCTADLTRQEDVLRLFGVAQDSGDLDLLVNNAGRAVSSSAVDLSLEDWRQTIEINLTAAFLCAREALRLMIPRQIGRIINIGSISAKVPRTNSIAYTASKFGLEGLTRALALEGRAHGITASIIHPGATDTELGGGVADPTTVGRSVMATATVAELVVSMASLPSEANLLDATVLPIGQPFLGRG